MRLGRALSVSILVVVCSSQGVAQRAPASPSAAALETALGDCTPLAGTGQFASDVGRAHDVPICTVRGAVWWRADMDIDCDGGRSRRCRADPAFQPQTSATDSQGRPLDASRLPYVVIPLPSRGFDYAAAGIRLGTVVAVVYRGRVVYGIFGDEGPRGIIGEASYALAVALGVDPHPVSGGADGGVTYVAFTGTSAVVSTNEDSAEAERIGRAHAAQLVARTGSLRAR